MILSKRYKLNKDSLVLLLAFLVGLHPLLIAQTFGIWPPLTMVAEIFGAQFAMFPLMYLDFHYAQTGAAYFTILTTLPSAAAHAASIVLQPFQQQHLFCVMFYLLHACLVAAIVSWSLRCGISRRISLSLLLVPISTAALQPVSVFGMMINYNKATELLLMIAVILVWRWLSRDPVANRLHTRTLVLLGGLCGLAMGIKFSYIIFLGPLFALAILRPENGIGMNFRNLAKFTAIAVLSFFFFLAASMFFDPRRISLFIKQQSSIYGAGWASQNTPFLLHEFLLSFGPNSYYFALQILFIVYLVLFTGTCIWVIRSGDRRVQIFLWAQVLIIAGLCYLFWVRRAQGTMIDISLYLVFGSLILASLLARVSGLKKVATCIVLPLCFGVFLAGERISLKALSKNSAIARELEVFRGISPDLPVIYYMQGLSQPILFPSPYIFAITGSAASPSREKYLHRFYPEIRMADPDKGVVKGRHLAIIPEYLDLLPVTAETRKEWPDAWPEVAPLVRGPLADVIKFRDAAGDCREFQFLEVQNRRWLLYFASYAHKITACWISD